MTKYFSILTLLAIVIFGLVTGVQAQEAAAPQIIYYMAADEEDVQQVYQLVLGGDNEARQITYAERDIVTFGAAHDGLSVAYISDGQLWLQPLHTEEPEALAEINGTEFLSAPVYSQDNQYIAYNDDGVWLFDLGARETRQLLVNVPLEEMASNAREFRIFQPEQFVLNDEGKAAQLIVDVGVWEWGTAGVYDLATDEFVELEGHIHTSLLPLSDGRVLVYGNSGMGGEPSLDLAESLDDINTFTKLVNFYEAADLVIFLAEQAVELEPGVVRVFGWGMEEGMSPEDTSVVSLDFNIETGEVINTKAVTLSTPEESELTYHGQLSPDGTLLPVYLNTLFTEQGSMYGEFKLVDVITGEEVEADFPETVGVVRWQE